MLSTDIYLVFTLYRVIPMLSTDIYLVFTLYQVQAILYTELCSYLIEYCLFDELINIIHVNSDVIH